MNRYEFLRNFNHGLVAFSVLSSLTYCTSGNGSNASSAGNRVNENYKPDLDVELTAAQNQLQVFSGNTTDIYTYMSNILKAENANK